MTQVNTSDRPKTVSGAQAPAQAGGTPRGPRLWFTDPARYMNLLERFRGFRNKLLAPNGGGPKSVFVITGAEAGVGASTVAFNLGLSFGLEMLKEKTLIVDAVLRRPSLHTTFNVSRSPGLQDHLLGRASLEEIIRPSGMPRLSLIPIGETASEAESFFAPGVLVQFLETARRMFDFIIIDTAPALQSGQTNMIAAHADGTILVVEASRTRSEVVNAVQSQLHISGAKLVGGFLNKRRLVIPEWLYRYV